jgi:hypothetical protein
MNYLAENKERDGMDKQLSDAIATHGAENILWTFVRTLSIDNYDEFLDDIYWALGEDRKGDK